MNFRRIMILILSILFFLVLFIFVYMRLPKFGRLPRGTRLERIEKSPQYNDGKFRNQNPTPRMTNEQGFSQMTSEYFSSKNKKPNHAIPSVKTDLFSLDAGDDVLVWFGHSSYYLQIDGVRILVDPVFSGHASPFVFSVRAFEGTDRYTVKDIPEIDYLVITHDHWDHLDYKTVRQLRQKVRKVVTGLGTGEHLERWGYGANKIVEMDWYEKAEFRRNVNFHAAPARHFSGRGIIHEKTLWASFVLETPSYRIFLGGDGGYDNHFKEIGDKFGEFDLAILENGQYNESWKYIHMMPEQVLRAAKDLNAERLLPVHCMKFALANHTWDEPLKTITEKNEKINMPLVTPKIGEPVFLKDTNQNFSQWWTEIGE